jgi:uncharacterized protein YqeY
MTLKEEIRSDLTAAMKEKDSLKLSTLRLLVSAITNAEKERGNELSDEEVLEAVTREAKKRTEAIEAYKKAGRDELADKEAKEKEILQKYLPPQLSDEELKTIIAAAVKETGASEKRDMSKVMSVVMPKVKGKADGRKVNEIVNEMLG